MGFGFLEAILSWLNSQVGKRTDAADAAGSLHAKVTEELGRIGNPNPSSGGTSTLFTYLRRLEERDAWGVAKHAYKRTKSSSWLTLLSVSGKGIVVGVDKATSHKLKITIDDTVVVDESDTTNVPEVPSTVFWPFSTSLLIQVQGDGSTVATSNVAYVLK